VDLRDELLRALSRLVSLRELCSWEDLPTFSPETIFLLLLSDLAITYFEFLEAALSPLGFEEGTNPLRRGCETVTLFMACCSM
jgi:hypothetical protein